MDSPITNDGGLSADAIETVKLVARKEGIFAGLSSGLASAVIGQRLFGLKRNPTLLCGVLSGVLSGVLFTQAFRDTAMAKLRAEEARLQSQPKLSPESQTENLSV